MDEQYGGREARRLYFNELRETKGDDAIMAALDKERQDAERLGSDPARQAVYIRQYLDAHAQTYLKAGGVII